METIVKAQEQFIEDFLLVSENDYDTYMELIFQIKTKGVAETAEKIQEEFENWISGLAEAEDDRGNPYGSLMLKQLLIGWGSDTFFKIAKRFEESVA